MLSLDICADVLQIAPYSQYTQGFAGTFINHQLKSSYFSNEMMRFFNLCSLPDNETLMSGYFTIDEQIYAELVSRAYCDRWSINWAKYFQHFVLKVTTTNLIFDFSVLQEDDNQLHFYWDGKDWYYLYVWHAETESFLEAISTEGHVLYLRQGKGRKVYHRTLAHVQN